MRHHSSASLAFPAVPTLFYYRTVVFLFRSLLPPFLSHVPLVYKASQVLKAPDMPQEAVVGAVLGGRPSLRFLYSVAMIRTAWRGCGKRRDGNASWGGAVDGVEGETEMKACLEMRRRWSLVSNARTSSRAACSRTQPMQDTETCGGRV